MPVKLENWREYGQDRHFELLAENYMFCVFTEVGKDESVGWCKWNRDASGCWNVLDSSRGDGMVVVALNSYFGNILDEIHLKLIVEKELL